MARYTVKLTEAEREELQALIQKGGKGYRIRHAQILMKLDQTPENTDWTYDRIKDAYGAAHGTTAGIAKRYVFEGVESALGRKTHDNYRRKVTGEVEAHICAIACSEAPEGRSHWTMQMIADELIRLEIWCFRANVTHHISQKSCRSLAALASLLMFCDHSQSKTL